MTTRHDEEVRKEIARLKREGFTNIKAALLGYEPPGPIGKDNRIPDVEATKRGKRVIAEIEEEDQVSSQKHQISAFRRHTAQKKGTQFILRTYRKRKPGSKRSD